MYLRYFIAAAVISAGSLSVFAQSKLDFSAQLLKQRGAIETLATDGQPQLATLLVSLNDDADDGALEAVGAEVESRRGNIAIVRLPASGITLLEGLREVKSVSGGRDLQPTLFNARAITSTNSVQQGTAPTLTRPYRGAGVVAGFMDQGIDPNHINFRNADGTASRVKSIYTFLDRENDGVCEEYTTPEEIAAFTTDNPNWTHATHVCGIMAGSYNGPGAYALEGVVNNNGAAMPFYGVATDADIVMSSGYLSSINICMGVDKVIEYAEAHKQPAVVNLSLGSVTGPHDGSDLESQYLAEAGKYAIICMASGNDGYLNCSVQHEFTDEEPALNTGFTFNGNAQPYFEFWNSDDEPLTLEFRLFNHQTKTVAASYTFTTPLDDIVTLTAADDTDFGRTLKSYYGDNAQILLYGYTDPNNHRSMVMGLFYCPYSAVPAVIPAVSVTGAAGSRVDGYVSNGEFHSWWNAGWLMGNPDQSVSSIACGDNVIVVGAMQSTPQFTDMNGTVRYYSRHSEEGEMTFFSSYGPTFQGRPLPDLCAPGTPVVSSISYYNTGNSRDGGSYAAKVVEANRTNYWQWDQGTSMSCPYVSGTVALMLEVDPTLTVNDARSLLAATCDAPASTASRSTDDSIKWGAGTLNVEKVLIATLEKVTGIGAVHTDVDGGIIITSPSRGCFDIYAAGATTISARVVALSGATVASGSTNGNSLTLNASSVAPGIYLLQVSTLSGMTTEKIRL